MTKRRNPRNPPGEPRDEERPAASGARGAPINDWTDARLVEECLQHDDAAWATLIRRYRRLIFSFPVRYGADPQEAADVFQTVCIHLFRELPRLRKHESLRSWLMTVSAHESFRWKQKRVTRTRREGGVLDEAHPDKSERPFDIVQRADQEQRLREAIGRLAPRCQELIRLLFYEQPAVPYAKVARRLGLAVGSIGLTRERCLKHLQAVIEEMGL